MIKKTIFLFSIILIFGFLAHKSQGQEITDSSGDKRIGENIYYHINLDRETIARGYTVAFEKELKLSLVPGILDESTGVEIIKLDENLPLPWSHDLASAVFQFEFKNKAAYDDSRPFYIQFAYGKAFDNGVFKRVMFYDKNHGGWRPLPTVDFPGENFVRSLIHLPFARIAVFSDPERLGAGAASWYRHKGGDFAASPDFPPDSRLRVYNTVSGGFVDVTVNDYGPDRSLHPDRVIDLDREAFRKIGALADGIIKVKIEPLYVTPAAAFYHATVGEYPESSALASIVYDETEGRIIWSANATATLPLASLTKLVAAKVFLETSPDLSARVIYRRADEEYNYEHCAEWESARVRLREGDEITLADAFYSSLVGSANNTVETMVRASRLERPEFIARMNEVAAEWGASSTVFYEPTGLSPDNVSTAYDYALITREVYREPLIQQASTLTEYSFTTINTERPHRVKNSNLLARTGHFAFTGAKTGYLHEAGYCLMVRALGPDHRQITVVTLNLPTRERSFSETADLLRYGLRAAAKPLAGFYPAASGL